MKTPPPIDERRGSRFSRPADQASTRPSNKMVDRYRSPKSGSTATIVLPAFSGRFATSTAAESAAPEEMPTSRPSWVAAARANSRDWSMLRVMTSATASLSRISGTKFAPRPWILCGPGWPPDRIGDSAGSTAMTYTTGLRSLGTGQTPETVPPVPTPATTMSTLPSVSAQISSAVVRRCTSRLAGLAN